jgi:serine/threonine protein kinase
MTQILSGVLNCHGNKIIHRDLKVGAGCLSSFDSVYTAALATCPSTPFLLSLPG